MTTEDSRRCSSDVFGSQRPVSDQHSVCRCQSYLYYPEATCNAAVLLHARYLVAGPRLVGRPYQEILLFSHCAIDFPRFLTPQSGLELVSPCPSWSSAGAIPEVSIRFVRGYILVRRPRANTIAETC